MNQKAKKGGLPAGPDRLPQRPRDQRRPRDPHHRRRSRTCALITWAFEAYATGDYTLETREKKQKQRKHSHYLKGTIFCARCQSRLCFGARAATAASTTTSCASDATRSATTATFPASRWRHRRSPRSLLRGPSNSVTTPFARCTTALIAMSAQPAAPNKAHRNKRASPREGERRKLLQAPFAGAIELDLLKEEQDRISASSPTPEQPWPHRDPLGDHRDQPTLPSASPRISEKAYRRAKPI